MFSCASVRPGHPVLPWVTFAPLSKQTKRGRDIRFDTDSIKPDISASYYRFVPVWLLNLGTKWQLWKEGKKPSLFDHQGLTQIFGICRSYFSTIYNFPAIKAFLWTSQLCLATFRTILKKIPRPFQNGKWNQEALDKHAPHTQWWCTFVNKCTWGWVSGNRIANARVDKMERTRVWI